MKVLYVVGSCLTKNTSANMSHNAYVQGLIENGCDVDIIMAKDSWGEHDNALPRWEMANYYEFDSQTFADKIRKKATKSVLKKPVGETKDNSSPKSNGVFNLKIVIRKIIKKAFYILFPTDPIYPLEKKWLKEAIKFKSNIEYDLVISNSSPAASHKLVGDLLKKNKIKCKRWVQIWEDPWYFDLYGGHSKAIRDEEHSLLRDASEIYYVSPLTLEYQKKYYSDCAHKMMCIPLPYFEVMSQCVTEVEEDTFGYFGDYFSHTRNIIPFYNALKSLNAKGYIYGDSDIKLEDKDYLDISGRVTLDKLSTIQEKVGTLVHLCNLKGGQIPGKIYHYSSTTKPILFILDGTEVESEIIKNFFNKYNRYYFCNNDEDDIKKSLLDIMNNYHKYRGELVEDFKPQNVVNSLLDSQ